MGREIHLGQQLDPATLDLLADFICGDDVERFPLYHTGGDLTRFFQRLSIDVQHAGTRKWWTLDVLTKMPPSELERVLLRLVDLKEYQGIREVHSKAVEAATQRYAAETAARTH